MSSPDFNLDFVFEFIPALENMPSSLFDKLTRKLNETITQLEDIKGVFIISTKQRKPVIYSKRLLDYEKIKELAELVNSMDLIFLLKDLGSRGYHGTTTLDFPEFGLGLLKLNDTDILAVLIGPDQKRLDSDYIENTMVTIKKHVFDNVGEKLDTMPMPAVNDNITNQGENSNNDTDQDTDSLEDIPQPNR